MYRERLLDLLTQRTGHGAPWSGTGTSIVNRELMERTGAFFPQAHQHAPDMAALAEAGHGVLGFDMVMPLFSVCHEAAAMGMAVNWGSPNAMPESGPPIFASADDIRIPDDLIDRPGCATPLRAIRLLKDRIGRRCVICGKVFGPWTLAYHLFGIENFLIMTIDDPGQVQRILERLIEVTLRFAAAQLDAGADCLLLADHATRDLCSPQAYERFLLPVHSDLVRRIDAPLILHICGNTLDRVGLIARTGVACFHWDTKSGDPARIRQLAGPDMALMGGVSNLTLLQGQPDDVAQQAKHASASGIDIVGPECAVPLGTPIGNLLTIAPAVAAARETERATEIGTMSNKIDRMQFQGPVMDFGLGDFEHTGLIEFWIANEAAAGYCGKFMFVFDGQSCPLHSHSVKHETFCVVKGRVRITLDAKDRVFEAGDVLPVPPGHVHGFSGVGNALLLELSMPCQVEDNRFEDPRVSDWLRSALS